MKDRKEKRKSGIEGSRSKREKIVNGERRRRIRVNEGISMEKWKKY